MNKPNPWTSAQVLAEMYAALDDARTALADATLANLQVRGLVVIVLHDDPQDDARETCLAKMHGLESSLCNGLALAIQRLSQENLGALQ